LKFEFDLKHVSDLRFVKDINEVYHFGEIIGRGKEHTIKSAINLQYKLKCAIKTISKDKIKESTFRIASIQG